MDKLTWSMILFDNVEGGGRGKSATEGGSGAKGSDGRWSQEGATPRRVWTPDNERHQRGKALSRPRWWEGRKYLDSVTGDVLPKRYIMLTKFYFVYVHKGPTEFCTGRCS
jgi:hypothetical protein